MKKIAVILMVLTVFSCQEKERGLNGTAIGTKDGTRIFVFASGENNQPTPVDTAVVKNGTFMLELKGSETQTVKSLKMEDVRGNLIFIKTNEPLTFELYKDSLQASVVSGGKHNTLLRNYRDHIKKYRKKMNLLTTKFQKQDYRNDPEKMAEYQEKRQELIAEYTAYRKELIKDNPGSIVSVMVLSGLIRSRALPFSETEKLFEGLGPEVKNSKGGKQIEKRLKVVNIGAIGTKAPLFSGPTPSGETLALKDVMGKLTLIDFWASWCKPCRAENPNIVRIYNKYHDNGLNIVGVSLDKQKENWIGAIEADNLAWNHISYLQFWAGPIARKYNIRAIPASFLLDENGIIVAKDLRGRTLEQKVAELLQ